MDPISGCNIRLVFTLPPKDSTLQWKKCVHLWNNFPCISTLVLMMIQISQSVESSSTFFCWKYLSVWGLFLLFLSCRFKTKYIQSCFRLYLNLYSYFCARGLQKMKYLKLYQVELVTASLTLSQLEPVVQGTQVQYRNLGHF